ncbi:MAG TPA: nuclear transport factor 2 family protein [Gaiellaceae bacterium]|nr:nuclear transport factor 2 family protein [Gaiellaceae bacterium]
MARSHSGQRRQPAASRRSCAIEEAICPRSTLRPRAGNLHTAARFRLLDYEDAARRWAAAWATAWPRRDVEPITGLYAENATYRALAFREPDLGLDGVMRYLEENFAVESEIACRFGEPLVSGRRAAVEWWANWLERGEQLTLAGATVLTFDDAGKVVDHRDYWNEAPGRIEPYAGW